MEIPHRLLEGIDRLEPLPPTVQRLILALNEEDVDFAEVVAAVEFDAAVTSNILRIANSPVYGGRAEIQHIRDAIVRLGTAALLDIVLVGHLRTMKSSASLYGLSEDDLWLHGAASSLAVRAIAREAENRRIPAASGIAALIHDIGKLIMVRYLDADVSAILELCRREGITFVEAERELLSCDHAVIGGAMARKWNFPEAITVAIEQHHSSAEADPTPMLDAVILANLAAKAAGVGLGAEGLNLRVDANGSRERLGLTLEGFERACAQTVFWLQDLQRSFGVPARQLV
jgi:putative nucleotidyltransferase with HDIG domain